MYHGAAVQCISGNSNTLSISDVPTKSLLYLVDLCDVKNPFKIISKNGETKFPSYHSDITSAVSTT